MNDLGRFLKLMRPYAGQVALGILLSLATLVATVTLMAVSAGSSPPWPSPAPRG